MTTTFIDLPDGAPAQDTLTRLVHRLDQEGLEARLYYRPTRGWIAETDRHICRGATLDDAITALYAAHTAIGDTP